MEANKGKQSGVSEWKVERKGVYIRNAFRIRKAAIKNLRGVAILI